MAVHGDKLAEVLRTIAGFLAWRDETSRDAFLAQIDEACGVKAEASDAGEG